MLLHDGAPDEDLDSALAGPATIDDRVSTKTAFFLFPVTAIRNYFRVSVFMLWVFAIGLQNSRMREAESG